MTRLAATLLLALLGMAACGDDEPAPPGVEVPAWAKVAPEQIAEAKKHGVPVAFENDLGMRFMLIPAGTFLMGSPESEPLRFPNETQERVAVEEAFYLLMTEVTNGEYRLFKPDYDSGTYRGISLNANRQPVVRVGWGDATDFSAWLSARDPGRSYMLPNEDQWEYACRAETTSAYWWGDAAEDAVGRANVADATMVRLWKKLNGQDHVVEPGDSIEGDDGHAVAAPVGSFLPNPWGLHDMIGNVFEWCAKGSTPIREGHHAFRGGSWHHNPQLTRCAVRGRFHESYTYDNIGFRLVSPLPEPSPASSPTSYPR